MGQVLQVPVDDATASSLEAWARSENKAVEQLAAEALQGIACLQDHNAPPHDWREADRLAIRRGVAQADRGDLVPQSVVEREIADLLG